MQQISGYVCDSLHEANRAWVSTASAVSSLAILLRYRMQHCQAHLL